MVRAWNGYGTVWNGVWHETGPTPAQLCHHAAHLYQNLQFGARVAQQAILRLPAVPQPAATVSGAGANLPQVEREGGLQAIHS